MVTLLTMTVVLHVPPMAASTDAANARAAAVLIVSSSSSYVVVVVLRARATTETRVERGVDQKNKTHHDVYIRMRTALDVVIHPP